MGSDMIIRPADEGESVPPNTGSRPALPPLLVSVGEAARLCSISRARMYELIGAGDVPSVTIGRSRRIPLDELRAWVRAQVEPIAAPRNTD